LRSQYGRAGVKHIRALGMSREAMVEAHEKIYRGIISPGIV